MASITSHQIHIRLQYVKMLKALEDELTQGEKKVLLFLVKDHLKGSEMEKLKEKFDITDFCNALEEKGWLIFDDRNDSSSAD